MCCCIRLVRNPTNIWSNQYYLLIKPDEPHFVCELLQTKEFATHFHGFIMQRESPIPIVFCKPDQLSDYHTLGLYSFRYNQDIVRTNYIVPKYHLM